MCVWGGGTDNDNDNSLSCTAPVLVYSELIVVVSHYMINTGKDRRSVNRKKRTFLTPMIRILTSSINLSSPTGSPKLLELVG